MLGQLTIIALAAIEIVSYINYKRERQERLDAEYEKRNTKNLDGAMRKAVNTAVKKTKPTPPKTP